MLPPTRDSLAATTIAHAACFAPYKTVRSGSAYADQTLKEG